MIYEAFLFGAVVLLVLCELALVAVIYLLIAGFATATKKARK